MSSPDPSPSESLQRHFGSELRRYRLRADLTQEQLGDKIGYTGSMVSSVEIGRRKVTRETTHQLDELLATDGALERLWPLVDRLGHGTARWQNYVDREPSAVAIHTYQPELIPGLLQTEPYARAVIEAVRPTLSPDAVDGRVAARLTRQELLTRASPPRLWFILGEAALRLEVGSQAILADQLRHVLEIARWPHVTGQVLPFSAGVTPAMSAGFVVAEFTDGPDALHIDSATDQSSEPGAEVVAGYSLVFDHLRAYALPEYRSAKVLQGRIEELERSS